MAVVNFYSAQVLSRKFRIANFDFAYFLFKPAPEDHRDCEPQQSGRRLDTVALLPGLLLKLHVVEKDERVDLIDQVQEAQPGHISGLREGDFHSRPARLEEASTISASPCFSPCFRTCSRTSAMRSMSASP